jgi:hypothetical protein
VAGRQLRTFELFAGFPTADGVTVNPLPLMELG